MGGNAVICFALALCVGRGEEKKGICVWYPLSFAMVDLSFNEKKKKKK
jgi:hypothetical protein